MLYKVKWIAADDRIRVDTVEADSPDQARQRCEQPAGRVLWVAPASWMHTLLAPKAARFPLLLFSQELLALLESGVSVVEAIETLAEKESRPGVKLVLDGVLGALREGKPLSLACTAFPQAFGALYVATLGASERTGALGEAMRRYIAYAQQVESLRAKLVSAAIYPVLLVGVSLLVILFLMGYVIPRFAHIYEDMGSNLPFMSRVLMHIGQWVNAYWMSLPAAVLGITISVRMGIGDGLKQMISRQLWRIPVLGDQLRVFQLVRMYRTLGMLLRGGVAVTAASQMVIGLLSEELRTRLALAMDLVREGRPISQSFEQHGLTTPVALRMLRVGERAGNMGEMMERVASFHDEEIARWAEMATKLMGPVLMLVMGLIIGLIVVMMYVPIFQLAENIR